MSSGEKISVDALAEWVLAQPDIEGITLSGGEPMQQAGGLADLVKMIRSKSPLGVVCYTGYTIEHLKERGTADQARLLAQVDLLIDGPYVEALHDSLCWRGSSNQRLIALTDRYRHLLPQEGADSSAGLEFTVHEDGSFSFAGVPPGPGFRGHFEASLLERGVTWREQKAGIEE